MAAITSIAAGVSIAVAAGGTTASFIQAGKQRKLKEQAQADAEKAMAEARKKLEVNYYDQLAVQKDYIFQWKQIPEYRPYPLYVRIVVSRPNLKSLKNYDSFTVPIVSTSTAHA